MKKCRLSILCLLIIALTFPVWSADLAQIDKRLVEAEKSKNFKELDAAAALLKPLAATDEKAAFLLGKTLFLKEKILAVNAGAAEVNTPHLYTTGQYTPKAVLLIHGFTASPWEMSDLGKFLQTKGINAYAMRLAGHGTKPQDLLKIKWRDWYQTAEAALEVTGYLGKEVYVMGLSFGGTLTIKLAQEHADEIAGVVTLAPALYLQDWRSSLTCVARFFMKFNLRPLKEKFKPYYYEKRAIPAIWQLVRLARHARRIARKVTVPILIIQSNADKTVKPKGGQFLYDRVKSTDKNLIMLEEAPHVLTTVENPQQADVFEHIHTFLQTKQ